ncbi:MAG: Tn3 family transposase post-transcriptional regulator TnpC [Comamonas sp.]|uniref:Tn3 family transposase post-transcriptional regulator TnpC n=1 Tax=Delftia tsuruhatensis TaxID=180282 RepID=UPI00130ED4AA|nr:Tn3 family transposase post-transcriptional regulator TnpC [Delftia tsuruhatensis]
MSDPETTVLTAYGRLDRVALTRLQSTYDTSKLLRAVEQLDRFVGNARGQDGLRDVLLRVHGMAHAVVNGAGLSGSADEESLPELAFEATSEIRQTIATLQGWLKLIEPLETLQATN